MAKTAQQQARWRHKREKRAATESGKVEKRAERWRSVAAHEMGHACVLAVLGLPITEVTCRPYGGANGYTKPAWSRRAYVAAATALPPASGFLVLMAGWAARLVAGFSEEQARNGTEQDVDMALGVLELSTGLNIYHPKLRQTGFFRYAVDTSRRAVKAFLKQEHVAFSQLTDELRYSPKGYLRGGRVSEVLLEKGKDISEARRKLIATAEQIDKHIGTKQSLVSATVPSKRKAFMGGTVAQHKEIALDMRSDRNLADRARRAKKKTAAKARAMKPKKG